MFTLVLFVCYLGDGYEDIMVDVYKAGRRCLISVDDQRIHNSGCLPAGDYIDSS